MFTKIITFFIAVFSVQIHSLHSANIGITVMATGKYIQFVPPLVESAKKHFCTNHNVTFYVFTDQDFPSTDNIVTIYQGRLGWPFDTMMRFHAYALQKDLLSREDYLYACDADMLFVGDVGDEILSDLVSTQHPGFVGQRGSYETRPISKAYISDREGDQYFCGGFYGGNSHEFLKMASICAKNILTDLGNGFIAVWHDESHLNRYFVDHKPTKILTPSYCYPESWKLPYTKRLLALDKNHSEFQTK